MATTHGSLPGAPSPATRSGPSARTRVTCSACVRTSALLALAAAVLLPGAAAAHGAGGRTIAFVGEPAAQERGLYVGARGFDKGRALVAPGGAWAAHPSWSRSHTLVVFARGGDLFAASTGGGPLRRLTRTAAAEAWPTWGRDGRIVFQRGRDVLSMRGD